MHYIPLLQNSWKKDVVLSMRQKVNKFPDETIWRLSMVARIDEGADLKKGQLTIINHDSLYSYRNSC
jgi:hypothetical protein